MSLDPLVHQGLALCGSAIWLAAALHKARDHRSFRETLAAYELLPARLVPAFAWAVLAVELAVGFGLLLPGARPTAALVAGSLLGVYSAAIGANLSRGRRDLACGCGGPGGERPISFSLLGRNLILLLGFIALWLPVSSRGWTGLDSVFVLLMTATAALLYAAVDVALANASRQGLLQGRVS